MDGTTPYQQALSGADAPTPASSSPTPYQQAIGLGGTSSIGSTKLTPYQQAMTPGNVDQAEGLLGRQDWDALCQKFVEQVTDGRTGEYPSAVDAWNSYAKSGKGQTDFSQMTPGDLLYFSANDGNSQMGHVGIYTGDGKFVSATYGGVQEKDVNDWMQQTGQKPLGYVHP